LFVHFFFSSALLPACFFVLPFALLCVCVSFKYIIDRKKRIPNANTHNTQEEGKEGEFRWLVAVVE
jgi:hypothetical protein